MKSTTTEKNTIAKIEALIEKNVNQYKDYLLQVYNIISNEIKQDTVLIEDAKKIAPWNNTKALSERDKAWLTKLFQKVDVSFMPPTVRSKLISLGLIVVEVKLTEPGKKEAFIAAFSQKK